MINTQKFSKTQFFPAVLPGTDVHGEFCSGKMYYHTTGANDCAALGKTLGVKLTGRLVTEVTVKMATRFDNPSSSATVTTFVLANRRLIATIDVVVGGAHTPFKHNSSKFRAYVERTLFFQNLGL